MMPSTHVAPAISFLAAAFRPDDWAAVFLKSHIGGQVEQRVLPIERIRSDRFQSFLREANLRRFNVYISVNAVAAGSRSRKRDAISSIRHVFLEADRDGEVVIARADTRSDLPALSYILHSSPGRVHLFWRATGFDGAYVESLQKQLAKQLQTDPAATPITQTTRLPGFLNHKYQPPHLVTIEYRHLDHQFGPEDFPAVGSSSPKPPVRAKATLVRDPNVVERARRYLAFVAPAISGQHGDVRTFQVCCRLTRGFALSDDQALAVLSEWNQRCEPPWTTAELIDKLRRAARYGREPVGGLL